MSFLDLFENFGNFVMATSNDIGIVDDSYMVANLMHSG